MHSSGRGALVAHSDRVLAETLVAIGMLTTALIALAQLFAMSLTAIDTAKSTTVASIIADHKAAQLRALSWNAIAPSPSSVEYLDERGRLLASGGEAPPGAMYVRRWRSAGLPTHADEAVAIEIQVDRVGGRRIAHLTTVRSRRTE